MADRCVLRSSVILSTFLVLASYISNLNYFKRFGNTQTQTWESFSSTDAAYLVELQLNPLTYLKQAGGHLVIFRWKRFQKSCVEYNSNCTASFNPMSPLSEVAISILSQDRSDSVRSHLSLTYQKHWRQMLKSLTWMSGPQERISVSSKTPYCIMALISSPYLKRGRIYLCLTQASRSLVTNFSDRIVDNIKLEVACAPTPSQTSRLLCLRIYHLPATMAFNNFG